MIVRTVELEGVELDWAVAQATKAWEWAHDWFPTLTLDDSFSGVQLMVFSDGEARCQLVPNNPMRQGYEIFKPSDYDSQGGPLIDRYLIKTTPWQKDIGILSEWEAVIMKPIGNVSATGKTRLQAAMRALVLLKLGKTVDLPEGI